MGQIQHVIHSIQAATATTTSANIPLAGIHRATLVVKRSDHVAGSSAFTVDVSADGENWVGYNKLIDNATNTNVQDETRIATKTLSANGTDFVSMDFAHDTFKYMRVKVTETTDGTHDAWVVLHI